MRLLLKIATQSCLVASLLGIIFPAAAGEHVIEIVDFAFLPAQLSVQSGDTLTWINRDFVPHNIAGGTVNTWRSPNLKKGETFSIVLTSELHYICSLHEASMKGQILIQDQ